MNKDKVLAILLSLLSILLIVVPIVAAFAAHGWNLNATLLGESNPLETQFENLQNLNTQNMFGNMTLDRIDDMSPNDLIDYLQSLALNDPSLNDLNTYIQSPHSLNATVQVTSPFDFPIKIKNFSGNLKCNDHGVVLAAIQLAGNEVSFSTHETKNLLIIGTTTPDALTDVMTHGGFPTNIGIDDIQASLDIYGIVIEGAFGSV